MTVIANTLFKDEEDGPDVISTLRRPNGGKYDDPSCGPIPRIHSGYSLLCDSVILYQCHSGFKLLGSSSISCDPNTNQWSPTPPTCQ
ncbi:eosinophil peroxidase-like isoform X1, partial [Lates japonicus]